MTKYAGKIYALKFREIAGKTAKNLRGKLMQHCLVVFLYGVV